MMKLTRIGWIAFLTFLSGMVPCLAIADQITNADVTIDYTPFADGKIKVNLVTNKSKVRITLLVDGRDAGDIPAKHSAPINKVAGRSVKFITAAGQGPFLWRYVAPQPVNAKEEEPQPKEEPVRKAEPTPAAVEPSRDRKAETTRRPERGSDDYRGEVDGDHMAEGSATASEGNDYPLVLDRLNRDPFFGKEAVSAYTRKADSFTEALSKSENKQQFLIDNDIERFLNESEAELKNRKSEISLLAQDIVAAAKIRDTTSQSSILGSVIDILNNRYNQRETSFIRLKSAVNSVPQDDQTDNPSKNPIINYLIIGIIVLIIGLWVVIAMRKKKRKTSTARPSAPSQPKHDNDPANPSIVVRRRTTSILKKQSIDDVVDNPEFMLINSSEFTPDSAVRNIYIKNTCIKEIYNMYAEDLRNSNNPKEDGCMVLGRWVENEDDHTYDISLETVVLPGDDAVFKEYELNFGGKIKLRIAEKLRKLRRETNLQYDLVCWVHSHPGLGVFFSNSDDNVQMQLKHSQHPNFLIAFVVDILTSNQEMGIFTFRRDGSMNSKGDVTKMFSLEDMYKWALESDKVTFNPGNCYNILNTAEMLMPSCKGIELNNSSIIDLAQRVIEPSTGIVGWAVGTSIDHNGCKEFAVSGIVKADEKPNAGVIGVLLNIPHMSLPTIQRMIASESANLSFVMVYSSRQNTVTSIPMINGGLVTDEHFYGEETIDDLKIWTRRKR